MAQYAYACRPPGPSDEVWYVDRETIDGLPGNVTIVRVQVGDDWRCATVDRVKPLTVDRQLLRSVVPSDAQDCPSCAAPATIEFAEMSGPAPTAEPASHGTHGTQIQAAGISIQGEKLLVVAVGVELVRNPAEADMVIDSLSTRLGGLPVVLMGLREDGSPAYYGDSRLVDLVAPLPVQKMPWKAYSVT